MAKLFRQFGDAESAQGVWVPCEQDDKGALQRCTDGPGVIAFKVRRMPDGKRKALRYFIFGREQKVGNDKDGNLNWTSKVEKNDQFMLAVAGWCLLDSRNLQHVAGDAAAAAQWGEALETPVAVDADFDLTGKWSEKAKKLYLDECSSLVRFINQEEAALGAEVAKDEEGKGKVS